MASRRLAVVLGAVLFQGCTPFWCNCPNDAPVESTAQLVAAPVPPQPQPSSSRFASNPAILISARTRVTRRDNRQCATPLTARVSRSSRAVAIAL